jgi:ABC-type lipopolysaccharide export system ATPase subunit
VSFLLAEQNAAGALAVADTAYVLENGRVVVGGSAAEVRARDDVQELYLGGGPKDRTRFLPSKKTAAPAAAAPII